ncbi:MAG: helix-turn-helix domain-containing protein [Candidatus Bathyarchaeota archaeon]|nr:helix-turn-helix domain-containing protein [Candidatus Bathyarchaeota archaeon]
MTKRNDEIETVVFQALSHPMRRTIITILEANPEGTLYTELITELGLSTGKMNYHLEQLSGLIEKNQVRRYVLTSLGKKAGNQLQQLTSEVTADDEKYLRITARAQRNSLEPTVKLFLIIGIVAASIVIAVSSGLVFSMLTQGGVPVLMLLIAPLGIVFEVALLATLVYALRKTPAWLRRLERRFLAT